MRFLRWLRYVLRVPPKKQTRKDCWRSDGLDFHVPTPIWNEVVKPEIRGYALNKLDVGPPFDREGWPGVLCLACFDRRAERRGVDYSGGLAIMGRHAWLCDGAAMERVRLSVH